MQPRTRVYKRKDLLAFSPPLLGFPFFFSPPPLACERSLFPLMSAASPTASIRSRVRTLFIDFTAWIRGVAGPREVWRRLRGERGLICSLSLSLARPFYIYSLRGSDGVERIKPRVAVGVQCDGAGTWMSRDGMWEEDEVSGGPETQFSRLLFFPLFLNLPILQMLPGR